MPGVGHATTWRPERPGDCASLCGQTHAQASTKGSIAIEALARQIRHTIIEQSKRAGIGHIGSSLSIADLLAALYGDVLAERGLDDPERDRVVLSKGHAVLALYAALAATGRLDPAQLDTYCGDGTLLAGHPEHVLPGVDFSTGSLGQGLSLGTGAALAARMQRSDRRVFVLMSDAELNEGSVWEAAMFAAHHKLENLVAIIDVNGQQALGNTRDVLDLEPLAARWEAFGWDVHDLDGHDPRGLARAIAAFDAPAPHIVIARTTFGHGISFMENKIEWHYWPLSDEQHERALAELASTEAVTR